MSCVAMTSQPFIVQLDARLRAKTMTQMRNFRLCSENASRAAFRGTVPATLSNAEERPGRPTRYKVRKGPHLTAALICERAIEEKDGTLTLARVIDKLSLETPAPQPNTALLIAPTNLAVVLSFKNAQPGREYRIALSVVAPNGSSRAYPPKPVFVGGAHSGLNFIARLAFIPQQTGVYNFDFLLDGKFIARAPLLIEASASAGSEPTTQPPHAR